MFGHHRDAFGRRRYRRMRQRYQALRPRSRQWRRGRCSRASHGPAMAMGRLDRTRVTGQINAVPSISDDVTINVAGNHTIAITSGAQAVNSVYQQRSAVDQRRIVVGIRQLDAERRFDHDRRYADRLGHGGDTHRHRRDDRLRGSLEAQDGATVSLGQLTAYAGPVGSTATLEASGSGSKLLLPDLETLSGDATELSSLVQVQATSGGDVELAALTTVSGAVWYLESSGTSSLLDIESLGSFVSSSSGAGSTFAAENGGHHRHRAHHARQREHVSFQPGHGGDQSDNIGDQWRHFAQRDQLDLLGPDRHQRLEPDRLRRRYAVAARRDHVTGGSGLQYGPYLETEGGGATLELPNLTSIVSGTSDFDTEPNGLQIKALPGGAARATSSCRP